MKTAILALAVISALFVTPAPALSQETGGSRQQVEAARQLIREGARQFIEDELPLSDGEAEKFWPQVIAVEDEYVELIREFIEKHDRYSLTDADADEMTDRYFDIKIRVLQVRQSHLPRFREILSGMTVMRLYQLENKVQAEIDATLALLVPLADPS